MTKSIHQSMQEWMTTTIYISSEKMPSMKVLLTLMVTIPAKEVDLVKMEASVPEVELVTVVNANYSRMGNCKTIQPLVVLIVKNPFSVFVERP